MRHIVLVGLSGSGKTTLGRMAAERFSMPFVDLDRAIAERAGMSIPEIFKSQGEGYFREMETEATMEALSREAPSVIATGGGVVLRRRNVDAMRESGCVVFLDRPVENIARDILSEDGRPLVTGAESLYEMERRRRGLYLAAADTALPNSGNLEDAADRLAEVIGAELRPEGFSVIGDPIGHTLSPAIHGAIFDELGIDAPYNAVRIPARRLADYAETARRSDMRGFNVTIPHKTAIIPFLDEVENEAALCGAVNTVTVRGGRLTGYNTDMGGLLESLGSSGRGYRGEDILLLGAGGAARGVALRAAREGASSITILGRTPERAFVIASMASVVSQKEVRAGAMSPEATREAARGADIVVNATPLGMRGVGEDFPSLDFLSALPDGALVCDLVYNPPETSLTRRARELGLEAQNGLDMLIYQAILADELFWDRRLDRAGLYKVVKERLRK